jgi:hypothetical protein
VSRGCLVVKFPMSSPHLHHVTSIRAIIVIIEYCYYSLSKYQVKGFLGLF